MKIAQAFKAVDVLKNVRTVKIVKIVKVLMVVKIVTMVRELIFSIMARVSSFIKLSRMSRLLR